MAITATVQIIDNSAKWLVVLMTAFADGSNDETNVVKIDATDGIFGEGGQKLNASLALVDLDYDCKGLIARLQWTTSGTPAPLWTCANADHKCFLEYGGLKPPAGPPNATGSVQITTNGGAANTSYSILARFRKNVSAPHQASG